MSDDERRLAAIAEADQLFAALRDAPSKEQTQALLLGAMRSRLLLLCAPDCPPDGCVHVRRQGEVAAMPRVPYGRERYLEIPRVLPHCLHCGVRPGAQHHLGCLAEECAACGEMVVLTCSCASWSQRAP